MLPKTYSIRRSIDEIKKIENQIVLMILKYLKLLKNPQCIISVANRNDQLDIKLFLNSLNMSTMYDYFFFC